jgi:hypothetical protein
VIPIIHRRITHGARLRLAAAQIFAQLGGEAFLARHILASRIFHAKAIGDWRPPYQALLDKARRGDNSARLIAALL